MSNTFFQQEINRMNKTELWNGSIIEPVNTNKDCKYKLYPSGDATISNGRTYVSLPANLKLNEEIRKKYNIL